jgi:hypothetical protein
MITKYEKCKKRVINRVLKSYEKKGTTQKKQYLAIALQISEKRCSKKINDDDYKKMEKKIDKMINNNKIQQTNINNAIYLFDYYKKNKKYSKKLKLENKVMRLITNSFIKSFEKDNIKSEKDNIKSEKDNIKSEKDNIKSEKDNIKSKISIIKKFIKHIT